MPKHLCDIFGLHSTVLSQTFVCRFTLQLYSCMQLNAVPCGVQYYLSKYIVNNPSQLQGANNIPCIWLIWGGVRNFPTNTREIASLFHKIDHVRPARVFHLIKTLNLVVVGDQTREQDIPSRHAITNGHVSVRKPQALLC